MDEKKTNIYQALMQAQKDMGPLLKNATNPAFRSKYADLGSVIETITKPLHDNGLVFFQSLQPGMDSEHPILETHIRLAGGQTTDYICSIAPIVSKDPNDPQKMGAAITYMRRYSLMALLGLAPEDDDGNSASVSAPNKSTYTLSPSSSTSSMAPSAQTPAKSTYTPAGMGNGTSTTPAGRTFDLNSVYPCDVADCESKQEGKWAEICFNKFGKIYCGSHWSQAKSGTLEEEIPEQQTAAQTYGMDKEPLPDYQGS